MKPAMRVVKIQHTCHILTTSISNQRTFSIKQDVTVDDYEELE